MLDSQYFSWNKDNNNQDEDTSSSIPVYNILLLPIMNMGSIEYKVFCPIFSQESKNYKEELSLCLHTLSGGKSWWWCQGWQYHFSHWNCGITPSWWQMRTVYCTCSYTLCDKIFTGEQKQKWKKENGLQKVLINFEILTKLTIICLLIPYWLSKIYSSELFSSSIKSR